MSHAMAPIEHLEGWYPHIFVAILVCSEMDSAEGPPTDLLLDQILIDTVLGAAVILAVTVLGPRIERFLGSVSAFVSSWCQSVVVCVVCVCRDRTFTRLVEEAARLWCRNGLWYVGCDLFHV